MRRQKNFKALSSANFDCLGLNYRAFNLGIGLVFLTLSTLLVIAVSLIVFEEKSHYYFLVYLFFIGPSLTILSIYKCWWSVRRINNPDNYRVKYFKDNYGEEFNITIQERVYILNLIPVWIHIPYDTKAKYTNGEYHNPLYFKDTRLANHTINNIILANADKLRELERKKIQKDTKKVKYIYVKNETIKKIIEEVNENH